MPERNNEYVYQPPTKFTEELRQRINNAGFSDEFKQQIKSAQKEEGRMTLNTYIVAGIQVRKNDTVAYFGPETYRASSKDDLVVQLKKKYPGLLRDLKIIEVNKRLPQQE
jgi:hypothetical protein